jgi:membrane-bound ClpP family serine protease
MLFYICATLSAANKIRMPGSARAGLGLLFMGAILVGIGSYLDRGAISLYGLIMAISGFLLYIISSIIVKRKSNNRKGHYKL